LEAKAEYYAGGRLIDLHDPVVEFHTNIQSVTNAFYAKIVSKNVTRTFNENARAGITHGISPYGYTRGEDGKFKMVEEEAKWVRYIFKRSNEGIGTYTIANELNKEGVPTKYATDKKV
jgi:site-specific DNA recombinase